LTVSVEPVMKPASSAARNTTLRGDFLGFAEAIERDQRQDVLFQHFLRHRLHHFGVDIARADHVHGDAGLGVLQRQRLGEADVAGLGRRIIDLAELALLAVDRGDVDDAAELARRACPRSPGASC
jgi:hypothetical protein